MDPPDALTKEQNITAKSSLSKGELLKRAAMFPKDLSNPELKLLASRYWLNAGLYGSMDMREETLTSLNRARAVLENAKGESLRRRAEHHNKKKKMQEDAEKKLNQAHHWVH